MVSRTAIFQSFSIYDYFWKCEINSKKKNGDY